jgi:hypothetical protein
MIADLSYLERKWPGIADRMIARGLSGLERRLDDGMVRAIAEIERRERAA